MTQLNATYKRLSDYIQVLSDTDNVPELYEAEDAVATALSDGDINITQAAELQADITIALDKERHV